MPMATTAITVACIQIVSAERPDRVIAMISADRMKSVLMALATRSSSSVCAFGATVPILASCSCALCGTIIS